MADCRWPLLAEPYRTGLVEAVAFVRDRFDPIGIVAAGTIIRGNPSPSSDLDIYVLHRASWRQRLQKFFNGVPAELFVNPPAQVKRYLTSEASVGRPSTAHMLASGFVVFEIGEVVRDLRRRAAESLVHGPTVSEQKLTALRYGVADAFENALDIADVDPDTCALLLRRAVDAAIAYKFWAAGQWQPRHKETLIALDSLDPELAAAVRRFGRVADSAELIACARSIVEQTAGATGFFEWESARGPVDTT